MTSQNNSEPTVKSSSVQLTITRSYIVECPVIYYVHPLSIQFYYRLDQHGRSEVPQRELIEFEKQYDIPIIGVSNLTASPMDASTHDLRTSAPILNCLCERLWYRDQQEAGLVI